MQSSSETLRNPSLQHPAEEAKRHAELVSAGAHHCARGNKGGRACGQTGPEGLDDIDRSLVAASSCQALGQSRTIRSGAVLTRALAKPGALCLLAVRRRETDLHRDRFRVNRGHDSAGDAGAALSLAIGPRPSHRTSGPDHPARAPWDANDTDAAFLLIGFPCTAVRRNLRLH